MAANTASVAAGALSTLFIPRGILLQQSFAPELALMGKDIEDAEDRLDALLSSIKYERVREAHLLFVRRDVSGGPIVRARTDSQGHMVRGDGGRLAFHPHAPYAGLWSTEAHFVDAVARCLEIDPERTIANYPFFFFVANRVGANTYETGLAKQCADRLMAVLRSCAGRRFGSRFARHVHFLLYGHEPEGSSIGRQLLDGFHSSNRLPQEMLASFDEVDHHFLIARPQALSAIVLVEIIQCLVQIIRCDSASHWQALADAEAMAAFVANKQRHPEYEKRLKAWRGNFTVADKPSVHREKMADEWQEYIYGAASAMPIHGDEAHESRRLFHASVQVLPAADDWKEAAVVIYDKYGVMHPARIGAELSWKPTPHEKDIMAYFDFYQFGRRQLEAERSRDLWQARDALVQSDRAIERLCRLCADVFSERSGYTMFLADLAAHVDDIEARKMWHQRYLDVAINLKVPWWEQLPNKRELEDADWQQFEEFASWLVQGNKQLYADWIGDHIKSRIALYDHVLQSNAERFDKLFFSLAEFDTSMGGTPASRVFDGGKVTVTLHPGAGAITVTSSEGTIEIKNIDVRVMYTSTANINAQIDHALAYADWAQGGGKGPPPAEPKWDLTQRPTSIKVEVEGRPARTPLPAWVGAISDFVSLVFTIRALNEDLREKNDAVVMLGLGAASLSLVHSIGELAYAMKDAAVPHGWETLGKLTNAAGGLLLAYEGVRIVHFEDGVPDPHLDGPVVAYAELVKGCVMVAAGGTSALFFLVGSSLATPVALAGTAVILAIEVGKYLWRGPDNELQPLEDAVRKALDVELGTDRKGHFGRSCRMHARLSDLYAALDEVRAGITY